MRSEHCRSTNFGESWKKEEERKFLQGFRKNQLNNKKFT